MIIASSLDDPSQHEVIQKRCPPPCGPLFFDDVPNLSANPALKLDGTQFDDWRTAALSSNSGVLYRPVAMFSFALNAVAAGELSPIQLKASAVSLYCMPQEEKLGE